MFILYFDKIYKHELLMLHFTVLVLEFSFSHTDYHTKVKELSLPYNLPIVTDKGVKFKPFPWVLAQCEMRTELISWCNG